MRRAVLLALLWAVPATADRGGYALRSFDVELTVEPDSDLLVQERLDVDFSEPRHGIYRTIPVRYTDPRGYLYALGFRLVEVVDEEGASHQADVWQEGRYVNVRIGDPERTVTGRVVYLLRYRITGAVVHFTAHDELYWNATGNEWEATIESSSATVRLPGPVAPDELELAAYTGRFGSREQEAAIELEPDGAIRYTTEGALEPLEGLTIVAAWPHGLVSFPGPVRRTARFLLENWVLLLPFLAFGLLRRAHDSWGRDPDGPGSVVVRYEPPADLRPGEIGALVDESVDLRDITATIVDLAVRGFLRIRIEEREKLFGLFRSEEIFFDWLGRPGDELRGFEHAVLGGLFASGSTVSTKELEHKFYRKIPAIQEAIWDDLVERRYVTGKPPRVKSLWRVLGVVAGGLTVAIGAAWAVYRGAVFPNALGMPAVAGVAVTLLFLVFASAMPKRTRRGVSSRAWALGFEEFVDRVERDQLEADRRRNVFESLLPYAMALGVASRWAQRFEDLYVEQGPAWFSGPGGYRGFSTSSFERSLSSAMSQAGESLQSAPRSSGSSGSGGGGSSGGGGGGGGGGSW